MFINLNTIVKWNSELESATSTYANAWYIYYNTAWWNIIEWNIVYLLSVIKAIWTASTCYVWNNVAIAYEQ